MKRKPKNFPESQSILGLPFTVECHPTLPGEKTDKEGEESWGDTLIAKRRIRVAIEPHETEEQLESTLLHETIHGILGVSGLAEILEGADENLEEALVVALEHGLHPLYQRRKDPL